MQLDRAAVQKVLSRIDPRRKPKRVLVAYALVGLAAVTIVYVIDRADLLVKIERTLNPLYQEPKALKPGLGEAQGTLTIPWLPGTVSRWKNLIEEIGNRYEVDPNLIAIMMTVESGGYSRAESPAQAQGLMQVTPPTQLDIARMHLSEPRSNFDIWDSHTNIEFGTAYVRYLRDMFSEPAHGPSWNETVELIATGYNGGPGRAINLLNGVGLDAAETVGYSRDVLNMWRERHADSSPTYERWYERGGFRLVEQAQAETGSG